MRTVFALVLLLPLTAGAQEWGSIKGRFVLKGDAPEPQPVEVRTDAVCIAAAPVDLTLAVGDGGGLANVVVMLRPGIGEEVAVHPDYAAGKEEPVVIDNTCCRFDPRIVLVRTGQELVIKNSDKTTHNTNLALFNNPAINIVLASGGEERVTLAEPESAPMPVACNVHPFMKGFVMVRDDPYAAVTDADGAFELKNLPAGEHTLELWHETGRLKGIRFAGETSDRRGRVTVKVPAGEALDVGEVVAPVEMLR
ncbi:hypothetical protein Pla175_07730 [Pirellulimonas nuda]|uniref:Rhamnogalacturonan lyase domain-containing protein n=1 Tax=Pirellulimonas nuda TaxID=2528009 RepID=A0A518D7F4_9BACT|nr:hypothetical protein [Pirellulimonas nuda]QDU87413.1 hypothetical protein Pla175_07730 [Pirellulimonas nuda]